MAIPVFVSQIVAASTDTVQVASGTIVNIPTSYYYFYFGSKSSAGNGRSFLDQLTQALNASTGVAWTVTLDTNLKLKLVHNAGAPTNVTFNRVLSWMLGYARPFGGGYPPDVTLTQTIAVPAGAGGYVAEYRSPWLWCPEMGISSVGPQLFDPAIQYGVPSSAGSTSRAPDGTAAFTSNGIQYDASFFFKGVQYLYRARQPNLYGGQIDGHEREDYETWWQYGPRKGRRFLMWRNKASVIGFSWAIGFGNPPAPSYVEYNPSDELRMRPMYVASAPPNLTYWDITISGFTTPNQDIVY